MEVHALMEKKTQCFDFSSVPIHSLSSFFQHLGGVSFGASLSLRIPASMRPPLTSFLKFHHQILRFTLEYVQYLKFPAGRTQAATQYEMTRALD